MRHYRVNKVVRIGGEVVRRKDILASDDSEAIARANDEEDCPICEVWRDGRKVGDIV